MSILISGIPNPKHNPLAAETPILRPVYDPGPSEIEIADKSLGTILDLFKIWSIKTCNDFE